jgi:hypothetical protein
MAGDTIYWSPYSTAATIAFPDISFARLVIRKPLQLANATITDIRQDGGGVNPDYTGLIANKENAFDINNADGLSSGMTSSLIARMSPGVLAQYSKDEIKQIVEEVVSAGTNVIVEEDPNFVS